MIQMVDIIMSKRKLIFYSRASIFLLLFRNEIYSFQSLSLEKAQMAFRVALCDSFDTGKGIYTLLDLISLSNIYLNRGRSLVNVPALAAVEEWITRMLRMLGLGEGSPTDSQGTRSIGWGVAPGKGEDGNADVRLTFTSYEASLTLLCRRRQY